MRYLTLTFICALVHAGAPVALAQSSGPPLDAFPAGPPPAGWSFTPALDYALLWDSNVLVQNAISNPPGEQVHVLRPRGSARFDGRRGKFGVDYNGAFVQHPTFGSLNTYNQRVTADASRSLSRRLSLSTEYAAASSPTTELVELVGVPFSRVGTRRHDVRSGFRAVLSRTTELEANYSFEHVHFDEDPARISFLNLNGGYSHGAEANLRHSFSRRLTLTGDYNMHRASVVNGQAFSLLNSSAGVDYQVSDRLRVFGSGGISYLAGSNGIPARRGPAVRVGLTRQLDTSEVGLSYSRSFVPSYSFGGTSHNEELSGHARVPVARRVFVNTAFALRQNEPLEVGNLKLRSLWFHGSVGYLLTDWVRIEGFSTATRQDIDRPGGRVNRYTFGIQITATTTARIR